VRPQPTWRDQSAWHFGRGDPVQLSLDLTGGQSSSVGAAFRRRHRRGIHRCESPLERQLAIAFTTIEGFQWRGVDDDPMAMGRWPNLQVMLLAQAEWIGYRSDFALVPIGWKLSSPLPLVVEVDGHQFHERTPTQAEYDRKRDRAMIHAGASVLRFTGREIWRDPKRCAAEVLAHAKYLR